MRADSGYFYGGYFGGGQGLTEPNEVDRESAGKTYLGGDAWLRYPVLSTLGSFGVHTAPDFNVLSTKTIDGERQDENNFSLSKIFVNNSGYTLRSNAQILSYKPDVLSSSEKMDEIYLQDRPTEYSEKFGENFDWEHVKKIPLVDMPCELHYEDSDSSGVIDGFGIVNRFSAITNGNWGDRHVWDFYEKVTGEKVSFNDCLWQMKDSEEKDRRLKTLALSQSLLLGLQEGAKTTDDIRKILSDGGFDDWAGFDAMAKQVTSPVMLSESGIDRVLTEGIEPIGASPDGEKYSVPNYSYTNNDNRILNDTASFVTALTHKAYESGIREGIVMPPPLTDDERARVAEATDLSYGSDDLRRNRSIVLGAYYELFTGVRSFDDYPEAAAYLDKLGISWRGGEYVGMPTEKDVYAALLVYIGDRALNSDIKTQASASVIWAKDSDESIFSVFSQAFDTRNIFESAYTALVNESLALGRCVTDQTEKALDNAQFIISDFAENYVVREAGEAEAVGLKQRDFPKRLVASRLDIDVPTDIDCDQPTPSTSTTTATRTATIPTTTPPTATKTTTVPVTTPSTATTTMPDTPTATTTVPVTPETSSTATHQTTTSDIPARGTSTVSVTPPAPQAYASGQALNAYGERFVSAPQQHVAAGAEVPVYAVGPKVDTGGHLEYPSVLSRVISALFS